MCLANHCGWYQNLDPTIAMTAGTSVSRTTKASRNTPAANSVDPGLPIPEQVHRGVERNVRWQQEKLKNLPEVRNLPLMTVGAIYDLEGGVRWLG